MIVIDGRAAARADLGGVERWARELTGRLPARFPGAYRVDAPPAWMAHRAGHLWEQTWFPLRAARDDLLLCPANLAPLASRRVAVILHDAAVLRDPGWYSPAYVRVQRFLLPRIAARADRVLTVSDFAAAELRELLGVEAAVVPGGVGEAFVPDADVGAGRRAAGLDDDARYVLTVAARTARKNLAALQVAARRLAAQGVEVVAVGGDRPQFAAEPAVPGVRHLGPIPDAALPGLYAGAQAFVLPSRYEGLGLPVLEAMACGTPVVAAAAAALPETCGDAAVLVDPDDHVGFADALESVVAGPEPWRARGLERVRGRTWDATADAVDAILRSP
ncbi:glycosyltransferase family 4 protein [Paraconexibacter sp.]|uniref:glycosyltransferase family 4 protein n=1 Tax=Paraconexibacter sp. TaxID=2949640 RepID=UPI0035674609